MMMKSTPAKSRNAKAAYATPKLTTFGNISELTGGPSSGTDDGKSAGAMAMM